MLFPAEGTWPAAKGGEDKEVPGVHILALPSSPVPQGLEGKRGFMCGEGWQELDTAVMSREVLWHPVAIPDTQLEVFWWGTGDVYLSP